jgi:glyoxylase-like metal-dependent hydrolase (beta-lactamase superfamily II)
MEVNCQMNMESIFDDVFIPLTTLRSGIDEEYAEHVHVLTVQIVNVCFVGNSEGWVMVDAGMPKSAEKIINVSEELFGIDSRPSAIILTHGHFDHVGAIIDLIQRWGVPVYAHKDEIPYVTGVSNYPPGDATVDGGLVSELSPLFPNHGINLAKHIHCLPEDGSVPGMEGWRWIHTPGHTPGHISLFRERDRVLIAGDAFVTVKQESLYKVMLQIQEISGPPKYFTTDWESAWESVRRLEELKPNLAITGHGIPMSGHQLSINLNLLVNNFDKIAIPKHGKFVH